MNGARQMTLSAALVVLICFFLPWLQVSCLGIKDSASGLDLARRGDGWLWLVPLLMLVILLMGLVRFVGAQRPAVFAFVSLVGGGLSAYLTCRERLRTGSSSGLVAAQMTAWFWLGLVSSLGVAAAGLWFYIKRSQSQ